MKRKKEKKKKGRINWKIPTVIRMIFCVGSTFFRMYIQVWNGSLKEFQHRFCANDCFFQCLVFQICVHNFCLQTLFSIMRGDCFFKNTFCWWVCNIYGLKCSNHSNLFLITYKVSNLWGELGKLTSPFRPQNVKFREYSHWKITELPIPLWWGTKKL